MTVRDEYGDVVEPGDVLDRDGIEDYYRHRKAAGRRRRFRVPPMLPPRPEDTTW